MHYILLLQQIKKINKKNPKHKKKMKTVNKVKRKYEANSEVGNLFYNKHRHDEWLT